MKEYNDFKLILLLLLIFLFFKNSCSILSYLYNVLYLFNQVEFAKYIFLKSFLFSDKLFCNSLLLIHNKIMSITCSFIL